MNTIPIPFISSADRNTPLEEITALLDVLPKHAIDQEPWPQFKNNCKADFSIAHCADAILLKYNVNEDVIRAVMHQTNQPVHKDNCVEFFIAMEPGEGYYNIEFNCFGICSTGYRYEGEERKFLPEEVIDKIKRSITLKSSAESSATKYEWELTMVIPIDVFIFSKLNSFTGKKARGNFFKCGDDLPEPHFLAWNMIVSEKPDFHLPDFFGGLEFGTV
jgi:hypothetical protein